MSIRIVLIHDHVVVREALRAALETESDLSVVGEADCGARGVSLACRLRPNVVLTNLLLPDVDVVTVTQRIRAEVPQTHVVIFTSMNEEDASIVRAVQAGAIGYVLKGANMAELVHAIRAAAEGQVHLSARATARLLKEMNSSETPVVLTRREREVLRGVASGRTNKEIACSLEIALTTVKSHVGSILDKLGVDTRTEAALHAVRYRMLLPDELQAA
jgi:two-component system, NarL family, response regulator LiaR